METRKQLIAAIGARYRDGRRLERRKILDEFVAVTGYHRKHATRVLGREPKHAGIRGARSRVYGQAVKEALVMLWEAADRICSKRLKAVLAILMATMERHGHLALDSEVRRLLLSMSAATMDRVLRATRQ